MQSHGGVRALSREAVGMVRRQRRKDRVPRCSVARPLFFARPREKGCTRFCFVLFLSQPIRHFANHTRQQTNPQTKPKQTEQGRGNELSTAPFPWSRRSRSRGGDPLRVSRRARWGFRRPPMPRGGPEIPRRCPRCAARGPSPGGSRGWRERWSPGRPPVIPTPLSRRVVRRRNRS